jgi:hypothetical protein
MRRKKKIHIPVYGRTLELIESTTGMEEIFKKHDLASDPEGIYPVSTLFWYQEKIKGQDVTVFHIAMTKGQITPGVIAHEAFHLANMIFKYISAEPTFDNDEPQAYLIGWIVDECHKFYKVKG